VILIEKSLRDLYCLSELVSEDINTIRWMEGNPVRMASILAPRIVVLDGRSRVILSKTRKIKAAINPSTRIVVVLPERQVQSKVVDAGADAIHIINEGVGVLNLKIKRQNARWLKGQSATKSTSLPLVITLGRVEYMPEISVVIVDGNAILLSEMELRLLNLLANKYKEVVTIKEIIANLWNDTAGEESARVLVSRLRIKLGDIKRPFKVIVSSKQGRNPGYYLDS
jgi:DNA-binding response OmpR family regulator